MELPEAAIMGSRKGQKRFDPKDAQTAGKERGGPRKISITGGYKEHETTGA